MPSLRTWWSRLLALFRKQELEHELDEEMRSHLEMLIEENRRKGMTSDEARYAALRSFGGVEQVKEIYRQQRGIPMIETLVQDTRYGLRQLRRSPGFTIVAVLTLALGIGANTAIFSAINAVMLKMLPVKHPEQLVLLNWVGHPGPTDVRHWTDGVVWNDAGLERSPNFPYRTFEEIRSRDQVFSEVFAFKEDFPQSNVGVDGQASLARIQLVSGGYFSGLGVPTVVGRTIIESDDQPAAPPVAVISYTYWRSKFGGSTDAVGKAITINRLPFTIIGVAAPEFYGLTAGSSVDISVPLRTGQLLEPDWAEPGVSLFTASDHWWLDIMGRLKPGVAEQRARAGLGVIFTQSITEGVHFRPGVRPNLPWLDTVPGDRGLDDLRRQFSKPLYILMTVVGLVLLVACANVANLLLARATARQKEMAVRLALGASRRRLIRQMLTESVLLATVGGVLGLIFARWGATVLVALISRGDKPIALDVHPDVRVLGFTAAACLLTGLLFGLAPALRGTRVDLTPNLKANAGSWKTGGLRLGLVKSLVVSQVGLSLVLLIGAGLFVRTLVNLEDLNLGFNRNNLLLFGVDPSENGYKGTRLADLCDQIQQRVGVLPGVRSVTLSLHPLLSKHVRSSSIYVPGYTPHANEDMDAHVLPVGTDSFETMQVPLLLGRNLGPQDNEKSAQVAVINETLMRKYFANQNPLGKQFNWGGPDSKERVEIVGVAADAKYASPRQEIPPTVYLPYRQTLDSITSLQFEVRTAGPPLAMVPAVRRIVRELDRTLPVYDLKTQNEQVDETLMQERLFAKLSSFFGALALLLACVGLYGVLSYAVVRRTGEIGIRMALGAERGDVLWMVLRESLVLVAVGTLPGLAAAWGLTRFVSTMLYGLKPNDPLTIATATLVMIAAATLAAYLPARHASRIEPMEALRHE